MLTIKPCDFATARAFVAENHRHNKPPVGHKFSICKNDAPLDTTGGGQWRSPFCPCCGAKMNKSE